MKKQEIIDEMIENDSLFRLGRDFFSEEELIEICKRYEELQEILKEYKKCSQK